VVGGAVGVVSGLLGIGGGVLVVPFLYLLMAGTIAGGLTVLPEHQAALAHATSLALIIPTAVSGLISYHRRGAVVWRVVFPLALGAVGAALVGAQVAARLPSISLKLAFGGFLLLMSWRLASGRDGAGGLDAPEARISWGAGVVGGSGVGFLSALLGVGGGIVAVPVLVRWAKLDLHRVVPASLGIISMAALAGTVGYAWAGWGVEGLPPGSLGFVHLPILAALAPGAVLFAPLGARWNRALPTEALRRVFALLLFLIGARLVWVNGWTLFGG